MASGIDFLRAGAGIFVMKEKGILTEVWAPSSPNSQVKRICFDGRYPWFVVNRLGAATMDRDPR